MFQRGTQVSTQRGLMSVYRELAKLPEEPVQKTKLVIPPMQWEERSQWFASVMHLSTSVMWLIQAIQKHNNLFYVSATGFLFCFLMWGSLARNNRRERHKKATVVNAA